MNQHTPEATAMNGTTSNGTQATSATEQHHGLTDAAAAPAPNGLNGSTDARPSASSATATDAGDASANANTGATANGTTTSNGSMSSSTSSIANNNNNNNGSANGNNGSSNGNNNNAAAKDDDATRPGLGAAPRKVDVSHFPHYGLKRGMACTFCRRRKLRCSGDRPSCTNCVKYTKVCEYGPPVKEPKKQNSTGSTAGSNTRTVFDQTLRNVQQQQQQQAASVLHGAQHIVTPLSDLTSPGSLYDGQQPQLPLTYDYFGSGAVSSNGITLDASLMAPSTMAPGGLPYQPSPFSDFQQQSPFVATPQHTQPPLLAQPIIGMPPYVQPGFSAYNDPNAAVQQQQWLATGVAPSTLASLQQQSFGSLPTPVMDQQRAFNFSTSATISRLPSDPSTPDDNRAPGTSGSGNADTPGSSQNGGSRPLASSMYTQAANLHYVADVSAIDGITERLGEFLFSPTSSAVKEEETYKRRRAPPTKGRATSPASVARMCKEYDGLLDASRSLLLDCFLAHVTLFFEMSVPRFRYRMTFSDRRRPSLALLNAMYLWATRISNSPQMSNMEKHFFELACKHLEVSTSTVDRLIDGVRAAMLLSAYSHSSGRHHEGWCMAGLAIRLVLSCGLHRIKSSVHKPEPEHNPFLRRRVFLLPPAEDAVELGERIHAFWAVFAIDRCGSLATGYPAGIRDEDITTPFGRHLADIASGAVSERDDVTVRDLYRGLSTENDPPYTKWIKCVAILERASKMCFLDPAEDSPYALAWNQYTLTVHRDPMQAKPPEYLNQPKYRNPRDYRECLLAVENFTTALGEEGVFPVVRKMHAEQDGAPEPTIPANIIMLHHLIAAIHLALHDVNSIDVENPEALKAGRKSVLLFRAMPPIPFQEVDAFVVLVWSLIAKVFIKEIHRLTMSGDRETAHSVSLEADTIIGEMARIGQTMYLARTQAKAVEELKLAALNAADKDIVNAAFPQLETFMFPQAM